jgi:enamine deaminase RidA (YjgF/YER057c/UK114 family)
VKRARVGSDSPWEARYGTARAVRRGDFVAVAAIAASGPDGRALAPDAHGQSRAILERLSRALRDAGASLSDVVRLRVYYADPSVSDGFGRALAEAYPGGAPAVTTVRVVALATAELLLEIEADAVLPEGLPARPAEPVWEVEGD